MHIRKLNIVKPIIWLSFCSLASARNHSCSFTQKKCVRGLEITPIFIHITPFFRGLKWIDQTNRMLNIKIVLY